jgi:hypothetical protein
MGMSIYNFNSMWIVWWSYFALKSPQLALRLAITK